MKHILTATDYSETATAALTQAARLAALLGARLTVLHVIYVEKIQETLLGLNEMERLTSMLAEAAEQPADEASELLAMGMERLLEESRSKLNETVAALPKPRPTIETEVVEGRPADEVLRYASTHGVDLIVLGTHGRGTLGKALLGSVSDDVIRRSECPVMVVRK